MRRDLPQESSAGRLATNVRRSREQRIKDNRCRRPLRARKYVSERAPEPTSPYGRGPPSHPRKPTTAAADSRARQISIDGRDETPGRSSREPLAPSHLEFPSVDI